jgi:PAS domain S-box-containing protein
MNKTLRVLHVEDSEQDVALLTRYLSRAGYELISDRVDTLETMKAALEAHEWDVILCDYSMPHFNGLKALELLKETKLDIPFIIISGTVGEATAVEAMRAGAHDYLMKDNLVRLAPTIERELHEAENRRAWRQAEERLRLQSAALESAANAIVLTDEKGVIIWVNDAFTNTTGYSKEEVLGKSPRLLKSGKQDHAFYQNMWDTILAGKIWRNTIINRCKDGTFNHDDLTITPIRNSEGRITHFVGIKQDITEKTRAEEAQRSSELRYRRLFESAKDGILILDANSGRIVDVNPFLIELLGFSKEEFIGKELWQIGLFKDVAASRLAFAELQQRGYIRYADLPLETRAGLVKPVEFVSNSYLVGESRVIQCNIRDITERKRFEKELQEKNLELEKANLAKDRFLASMSHELRTPLNAIIGFTGTLLMKLPGPLTSDQEHQLRIVQSSGKHLHSLINDLLDLAKIESGKVEIKYEPITCQGVVAEVAAALRPLAENKGLEFIVKAPETSVRVESDRRILSQILINLTNNAIKFTEKGKVQIELNTRPSNGHMLATIDVIDTGIGIRPADKEKLFQAFQQVDGDHRSEGTGLGLYLSQKLAVLVKGRIELESEYGKGSVFRLLIPKD